MFSLYSAGENEKADTIFKSHSCVLNKDVNVEEQKSENNQAKKPDKSENAEMIEKKKPFWKTGKFWMILFAVFSLYVIIISPTTNSAQTVARKSYISQLEPILTENYDGHKIMENGDVLTVSVWDNRFTSTLLYTGIALGQTSKIAPVGRLLDRSRILENGISARDEQIQRQEEDIRRKDAETKELRNFYKPLVYGLCGLCILLTVVWCIFVVLDARQPGIGLIRSGAVSPLIWIGAAAVVVLLITLLCLAVRRFYRKIG